MVFERCFVAPKGVPKLLNGFGRTSDRSKFLRKANLTVNRWRLQPWTKVDNQRKSLSCQKNNVYWENNRRIIC